MKPSLILLLLLSFSSLQAQKDSVQKIVAGRTNSIAQQEKPYVILISSDGFRFDYAEKYKATNLLALSNNGVRAASMIPSFPSLTFPNHYALVTGLYPSHSGVVGNNYYDRKRMGHYSMSDWNAVTEGSRYGGTPLWVLAEQQKMLSASFYWVGSEADIKGVRPTYYYAYNELIPIDKRIKIVVDWLSLPAETRPHFISFYMPETDHAGHDFGPEAPQTRQAVLFVDSAIKQLTEAVKATGLAVNFIFLADHGMTTVNMLQPISLTSLIDTNKFVVSRGNQIFQLYAHDKKDIRPAYKLLKSKSDRYQVFLKNKMPRRYHFREKDDYHNRIGDIVVLPDWPYVFSYSTRKIKPGAHGYDASLVKDMHTVFYAWGPAFKEKTVIPSFKNVNVYPVITKILGLTITEKIDGTTQLADTILR